MKKLSVTIYPLSPKNRLSNAENKARVVYRNYLDTAFKHPSIRNIAVTGSFGIGKSSIIRDYDNKGKFLYINLGEYIRFPQELTNTKAECSSKETGQDQQASCTESKVAQSTTEAIHVIKNESEPIRESKRFNCDRLLLDEIERKLLLQIYARFHRQQLPGSTFHMAQEPTCGWKRLLFSIGICYLVMTQFVLKHLAELVNLWNALSCAKLFNWLPALRDLVNLPHKENGIRLMLITGSLLILSIFVCEASYWLFPKLRNLSLSLKNDSAEVSFQNNQDSLDKYTMDLIYCLTAMAKEYGNTVVFEDMDRLDERICLALFQRLHEINHMVNLHLKPKHTPIRFVYVANDELISQFRSEKFFDYILPVISVFNERSVAARIRALLEVEAKKLENCDLTESPLIEAVSCYLTDFRMMNAILNEYFILFSLYRLNHPDQITARQIEVAESLFAVAIYKYFWPKDYCCIAECQSMIFPVFREELINEIEKDESKRVLLTYHLKPYLKPEVFYYIGFSDGDIAKIRKGCLNNPRIKENIKLRIAESILKDEVDSIRVLMEYCDQRKDRVNKGILAVAIKLTSIALEDSGDEWRKRQLERIDQKSILEILCSLEKYEDEDFSTKVFIEKAGSGILDTLYEEIGRLEYSEDDKEVFAKLVRLDTLIERKEYSYGWFLYRKEKRLSYLECFAIFDELQEPKYRRSGFDLDKFFEKARLQMSVDKNALFVDCRDWEKFELIGEITREQRRYIENGVRKGALDGSVKVRIVETKEEVLWSDLDYKMEKTDP